MEVGIYTVEDILKSYLLLKQETIFYVRKNIF